MKSRKSEEQKKKSPEDVDPNDEKQSFPRDPVGDDETDFDSAPEELGEEYRGLVRSSLKVTRTYPVGTQCPDTADGLYGYYSPKKRFGIKQTVDALLECGRIWSRRGIKPDIGIGDISLERGGPIDGHKSHRKGIDVDVRPMRNDGQPKKVLYTDPEYSRTLTQQFVDLVCANGVLGVQIIWFNDPGIRGVFPLKYHSNHLHVRFLFPHQAAGFPVLIKGTRGPSVRELQRRLNFWMLMEAQGYQPLTIDGNFGESTDSALRGFQNVNDLVVDGKAGKITWTKLPAFLE